MAFTCTTQYKENANCFYLDYAIRKMYIVEHMFIAGDLDVILLNVRV